MSDHRNPLSVNIPYEFKSPQDYPTEAVAARFQAYRDILKSLIAYLEQYASVEEEIVRQQARLQQAVGASSEPLPDQRHSSSGSRRDRMHEEGALSALNQFFLPIGNGSIQDIPTILTKFHLQNVQNGRRTLKEIRLTVIPKLDDLRKDLLIKIKEIKSLHNDFDSKLAKEITNTGAMLAIYAHSCDLANRLGMASTAASKSHHEPGNVAESIKKDPFLAKLKLQAQLKHQLREEDYLYRAYANLQSSSEQLESIVVKEVQTYLGHFLGLVESEKNSVSDFLVPTLTEGFLAKEPNFEWQSFVERNLPKSSTISNRTISGKFIDLHFPPRKLSDLSIPEYNSMISIPIKQGYLERKSKFLKSISRNYYVLTCSYLHEFKTHDLKKDPSNSISLDYCLVSVHSKDPGGCKFDLMIKGSSLMNRGHTSVFKCETPQAMKDWYDDLKTLTSLPGPAERAKRMNKMLSANTALEKKESRVLSILSTQTNQISLRSGVSSARVNIPSPKKRHSVVYKSDSLASSLHHRPSSTFSNRNQHTPQMSHYNDLGDALLTSAAERTNESIVDEHGDLFIKAKLQDANQSATSGIVPQFTQPNHSVVQYPNSQSYVVPNNSMIPQNYRYYINQASQRPQQFYDPVSQQFFTINSIPALQVQQLPISSHQDVNTSNGANPTPQYLLSSPLPPHNRTLSPGTTEVVPVAVPAVLVLSILNQDEANNGGSAPYPLQVGGALDSESEANGQASPATDQDTVQLADDVSKLAVTEGK
ncbi:hypothetical protein METBISCDRAFT_12013 [Metschnikowia bicuspidata]|uniref:PH domain-containing protein n=1 Tax=Metschnikowia bicuspidata TaxID=27322 RepID=A0A4P9ZK24_9ASCO|nr:hypothetical protein METBISCDRAFT_12013 [Metschnikowia bicuspidata]